jgi:hypothetical protein
MLNAPSHRSRRSAAGFAQSQIPPLNDDPGTIIAFPDETFGLMSQSRRYSGIFFLRTAYV